MQNWSSGSTIENIITFWKGKSRTQSWETCQVKFQRTLKVQNFDIEQAITSISRKKAMIHTSDIYCSPNNSIMKFRMYSQTVILWWLGYQQCVNLSVYMSVSMWQVKTGISWFSHHFSLLHVHWKNVWPLRARVCISVIEAWVVVINIRIGLQQKWSTVGCCRWLPALSVVGCCRSH